MLLVSKPWVSWKPSILNNNLREQKTLINLKIEEGFVADINLIYFESGLQELSLIGAHFVEYHVSY